MSKVPTNLIKLADELESSYHEFLALVDYEPAQDDLKDVCARFQKECDKLGLNLRTISSARVMQSMGFTVQSNSAGLTWRAAQDAVRSMPEMSTPGSAAAAATYQIPASGPSPVVGDVPQSATHSDRSSIPATHPALASTSTNQPSYTPETNGRPKPAAEAPAQPAQPDQATDGPSLGLFDAIDLLSDSVEAMADMASGFLAAAEDFRVAAARIKGYSRRHGRD
jgi:hypothetical protein